MPVEALTLLIAAAVVANLAVMAAVLVPPLFGRRSRLAAADATLTDAERRAAADAVISGGRTGEVGPDGVPATTYDRVVRIVSWLFLLATGTIVAVTGLWPVAQPAIFALVALAGLFVIVVHDVLPSNILGPAKFILEGSVAITFAMILVLLTGGQASPFYFVFPLIVGGAALVVTPRITVALTAAAGTGYVLAVLAGSGTPATPATIAVVGVNLTALLLLAYVAMVVGREQRRSRDAAIRLSTIDTLTSLYNRGFFFAALEREIARSARSGRGFCLLMIDLDELKAINDRAGHHTGDLVLRAVAEVIREGVRRIDIPARYGGDEFVAILPETDPTGGWVLAEKIRIGTAEMRVAGTEARASVSVGVVSFPDDGRTPDELMISADRAMYASKRAGRNRVTGLPSAETVVGTGGPGSERSGGDSV